jgi:hypothetical protein
MAMAMKSQGCQGKGGRDVGGNKDSNAKKLKEFQETMSVEDLEKPSSKWNEQKQLAKVKKPNAKPRNETGKNLAQTLSMEDTRLHWKTRS